ncbi:MAG TPA: hypothetical protein VKU02_18995 [Gemmataceae bacterium]|nr:hypothetical protein [Gemmataceae bacterium]
MRQMIWCGLLGAMLYAGISYWVAGYRSGQPKPTARETAVAKEDIAFSSDEPNPLAALLPDPAKLMADWPAFEIPDPLSPHQNSDSAKQEVGEKQLPLGLVSADMIRSADEAECFPRMPHSERHAPQVSLLGSERAAELDADDEEQEAEATDPFADPKMVEERLKQILPSYLRNGKLNGRGIDTLEFRPSDAKPGEFNRNPF